MRYLFVPSGELNPFSFEHEGGSGNAESWANNKIGAGRLFVPCEPISGMRGFKDVIFIPDKTGAPSPGNNINLAYILQWIHAEFRGEPGELFLSHK